MTTFVCVNWGNYCGKGPEYVNKLYDMVRRNLPEDYPLKFICYTDRGHGLNVGITPRLLPHGLNGWWNKLYLFKAGEFEPDETIIYLDLDTCITGPLDDIVNPKGPQGENVRFAILRDFYHPERYGPGMMIWKANEWREIWDYYVEAGCPTDMPLGDMDWINAVFKKANYIPHILQRMFPGKIGSYKVHASKHIPKGMSVVCFHGHPRPHQAGGWVDDIWKIGGHTQHYGPTVLNTEYSQAAHNIAISSGLPLPWLEILPENDQTAVIVGGGPSLANYLDEIRHRQLGGQKVFATNGTYRYLRENGIMPDYALIIDARPENAQFLAGATKWTKIYLASQCAEEVFEAARGLDVTLVHMNTADIASLIPIANKKIHLLSGGNTVGLNAMALADVLGFRDIHCFGFDSSYQATEHHAYEQLLNAGERVLDVEAAGRKFRAAPWMIQQTEQFQELASVLANAGSIITVHGDGLLPHVAREMARLLTMQENAA